MNEYTFDINNKKIYVAGSEGMVGSAVCRGLEKENCKVIKTPRSETDLIDISLHARIILQAISPLLAIRIFLIIPLST